jgi:predicted RecB family endonuclease
VTITQPDTEISRDRYGRPYVVPPNGGKAVPYTRCTTFVDVLDDKYNLQKWMQRMVALGLSVRPDLQLAVSAHSDDKSRLDKICDEAKEAATASAAATTGTALHALTERLDRGQDVGVVPDAYLADLAAYQAATEHLEAVHIEQFCVLDSLKIGGTPDRVVTYNGKRYIADVKTGSIDYGALKIAMQLAVYARSQTYDHHTKGRGDHGAEMDKGIIIHLPAGTGTCTLHWVDLLAGWEAVKVAKVVREWRSKRFADLVGPWNPEPLDPNPPVDEPLPLDQAIGECLTVRALMELWETRWQEFTDEHKSLAAAKKSQLQGDNAQATTGATA